MNKFFNNLHPFIYNKLIMWIRKTVAYFLSLILIAVLLAGVLAFNINYHFATPTNLESWLNQSKIYDHFVSQVISQSQQSIGSSNQNSSISLSDATVQQAAQNAFSPQLLQNSVNTFLNANYAWLQGKTTTPTFSIDLSQAKQSFSNQVGQYVASRFSSLPVCSAAQLAQLQNVDPLSAPCRPANLSAAAEGAQVTQQLATSKDFLPDPVLTASNIQPKNGSGSQPYYQKLSFAPTVFHWSSYAPAILAALAALLALAILFILPRRKGLRKIAGVLFLAGVLLIATKFVSDFAFNKVQANLINPSNAGPLQSSISDVVHRANTALTNVNLYFGIGLAAVALVIWIILLVTRSKKAAQAKPKPAAAEQPIESTPLPATPTNTSATDSPQTQPTGAPPLPRQTKPKRTKLVQ